jgi:putative hydrolase of the HAD superfamily
MKYFLFDIGNVLVNFDFQELYRLHAAHSGNPISPFSEQDLERRDAVESGRISDQEWLDYINQAKGLSWSIEDLVGIWAGMFSINSTARNLLIKAQQTSGVSVHTLSNIAKHHIDAIESNWSGFFDGADRLFLSYQIGARKPNPAIYRHALEQLNADPAHCFFIDDLPENVEAARAIGIQAYAFIPENYAQINQAAAIFLGE